MTNVLTIRSHAELIASIPHTLGFGPESSMVCLAFGDGPTARLDLPGSPEEMDQFLGVLTDVYLHRHHSSRMALVAYGEDGRACMQALASLGQALASGDTSRPEIGPVIWVNGDHWLDLLQGTRGTVDASTRTRMEAEFALRGHVMPASGREDLATSLQGDSTAVAGHLPAAQARLLGMGAAGRRAENEYVGTRLKEFLHERQYLSDVDAARVLTVIHDIGARDAAMSHMSRQDAPDLSEFWADLVRRAPSEFRDAPATLLALSSYLEGRGAHAWVALDQVAHGDPLAELVATALEQAIDPRTWDHAGHAATGGRIQHAALRDAADLSRRAQSQAAKNTPGIDAVDDGPSVPGR